VAGRRGQAQQVPRRTVQFGHTPQQKAAQARWELTVQVAGGGGELFSEERVALGAGDDGGGQRRRQGVPVGVQEVGELVAGERPEVERQHGTRAPDAVGQAVQPIGHRRLVGPVCRQQQDPPTVEVVRQEDDKIKR